MQLGFVGLGKMGANMVHRIHRDSDHQVVAFDFSEDAVKEAEGHGATGASGLEELVSKLEAPRAVWVMVPAGDATEQTVNELAGLVREAKTARTADPRAAAERVVNAAGLRGDLTAIGVSDGRVRLTFAAIDFQMLNALIEQLGREEQLFPAEALVAARVVSGSVRAELALFRPAVR